MDATDAFELRKHRVTLCAIVVAGSAIALAFACPTAASMDATAIEAEIANTQSAQVEDDTDDTAPAAIEIAPLPSSSPIRASAQATEVTATTGAIGPVTRSD